MTFLQDFFDKMKKVQERILQYIDDEDNIEENYTNIIQLIKDQRIREDKYDIKILLYIISSISNNHNRVPDFFDKIKKLILHFKSDITKNFSNYEIFKIFKYNKILLLFLIQEEIITMDNKLANIIKNKNFYEQKYPQFFSKEIKPFLVLKQQTKNKEQIIKDDAIAGFINEIPDNFEEKKEKGENDDDPIFELIRNDQIEEFIIYVNKENYGLNSLVEQSVYETNQFLIENKPSLIEYAAFYGSVQIFKYLYKNDIKLTPSLWLYAVHGNTAEIIHILEQEKVKPEDQSFLQVFFESIKCHHKDISNYIIQNYFSNEIKDKKIVNDCCFSYYNFMYIDENESIFLFACKNDFVKIVNYFIKNKAINLHDFDFVRNNFDDTTIMNIESPFRFAALNDNFEIIEILLNEVNEIKTCYFYQCENLRYLKIPSTITKIADAAFNKCHSLSSVILPSTIISIGSACFHDCFSLKEITIPSSVKTIEMSAFDFCNSMVSITFESPSSIETIKAKTFKYSRINEISIPQSVKVIGRYAFQSCFSLTKVEIPSSVTTIKKFAFFDCLALREITIPSSVTMIEQSAFRSCSSLKEANFSSSSISSIEQFTFKNCIKLEKVTLPPTVKTISKNSFAYCTSLNEINIPSSLTCIDSHAFHCCSSLKEIFIPSSVTLINEFAFEECKSLEKVEFQDPSSIESIERYTFKSCSSLQQIVIPSSVKRIKKSAFDDCISLIDVTISCSVEYIECYAFRQCSSLKQITIPDSVKTIENNVFARDQSLQQIFAPYKLNLGCGIDSNTDIQRY